MIADILPVQCIVFLSYAFVGWLAIFAGWATEESVKASIKSGTDMPVLKIEYPIIVNVIGIAAWIVWALMFSLSWFLFNHFIFEDEQ